MRHIRFCLLIGLLLGSLPCYGQRTQSHGHQAPSVPKIVRIFGVRVGYDSIEALERRIGTGKADTGNHPHSLHLWRSQNPEGKVEVDGFNYNKKSEMVIESFTWRCLDPALAKENRRLPIINPLPQKSGWIGTVVLGMTEQQVSQLVTRKLHPPSKKGNVWKWTSKGYARSSSRQRPSDYSQWNATLTFRKGRLERIDIAAEWTW